MGRRPVDEEAKLSVRVPRGQQGFWDIMRELRRFRLADVDQRCNVHRETIRGYLKGLERAGFVEPVGKDGDHTVYELRRDQPDAPSVRRDGTLRKPALGQEQMWRVMKMAGAGGFSADDLAVTASTEEDPVAVETARRYLRALHRAGYLAVVTPGKTTGGRTVYRLLPNMRTGPLAPQIQRIKAVWDPNLRRHVGTAEVEGGAS
ncbi:hypothetical protein [Caenispirillum bisanense]|uniref:Uncharacterized protein n=1 Tax=Caenispirillum bisanense TaxID=414052 RepID=A0A286GYQ8_9PROT|nr:hypothetical protein [Caenispirillum bisanense]SOE00612.1 hypothetical protein SAMN05421508_11363 [Caenispirillum bisanense]